VDHELDDGARGEELADLAPEGAAQEPLERDALDVFAGFGEVVTLQLGDDLPASRSFQVDACFGAEYLVAFEVLLGLLEKAVQRIITDLPIQDFSGEDVVAPALLLELAFDVHFDEQNLGDLIERGRGIELLAVADDVVAFVQQVRERGFFEDLEF